MALADSASILVIEVIENVMAAVFDDPVTPINGEDLGWVCHFPGATGDAVGQFPTDLSGFFVAVDALD